MFLRICALVLVSSGAALAGSRPACPGPAAPGNARCHAHVVTDVKGHPHATTGPSGYGPVQFRTAYGLPASAPTPVTIAIVDAYNDPNIESDLNVYSTQYGLPKCTTANGCFRKVDEHGGTSYPATNANWAVEIALDVEVAHGVCPNCKILLVESSSNSFSDLMAAEDEARKLGAAVISNSWGGGEFSGETYYDSHFAYAGVPFTFSSGDSGYGVEYPASSRYVNAVGGTTLKLNSNYTRYSETAWSGTGSGCSAYESKPSWQKDTSCSHRTVADVAADANPATGAAIYDTVSYLGHYGWFQVGGTSLASPLIAAVYALSGNTTNTVYGSFPYSSNSVYYLFDVTSGSNGSCSGSYLCTAKAGYDGPTGKGTPKGTKAF